MNILYLSAMFDYDTYEKIFTKEKKPMHAANKYHHLLCKGLVANGAKVSTLSVLPTNRQNCDKKFIRVPSFERDGFLQRYIPAFNIPVLRHISLLVNAFFATLFAKRGSVLIYDVLLVSPAAGALLAAKLTGKKCIGIVTDLPYFMPVANSKRGLKTNLYLMHKADGYIFLTRQMNDRANPNGKPFAVLEGHVDIDMSAAEHEDFDTPVKKVLYAGTLAKKYGIKNLCEGFAECGVEDAQLHIFGDGDYTPELKELCKVNPNIIYHGNRPNKEVVEAELESHLLVNPRPTSGEFTKYSFPSKTLEYMASGTPVLTAHLAGIPEDYDPYLYYFDDKSVTGLRDALSKLLSLPTDVLAKRGADTKAFALGQKSNIAQSRKILDFITENFKK